MERNPEQIARMQAFREQQEAERREQEAMGSLPIRELLQKRIELAPRISGMKKRGLVELAEAFEVAPEALEATVRRRIVEYATSVLEFLPQPNDEDLPLFDRLYELSVLARDTAEVARASWLSAFGSFESFRRAFLGDVSRRQIAMLRSQIMYATERRVHPERVVSVRTSPRWSWMERERFFEANGSWSLLPNKAEYFKDEFRFAESAIIDEVAELIENGFRPSDYSHASGSAALWPIGRHGFISNSADLYARGQPPMTGEAGDARHGEGLRNVYGDRGVRAYGSYNTISWFDEYFVTFGIDGARQEAFLESLSSDDWKMTAYESLLGPSWNAGKGKIVDFGGEGNLLGPRVPLSSVDTVYAWKCGETEVRAWIARFAPHASFVSLEANATLHDAGAFVNALAIQERISPAEAWRSLKRHAVSVN